mmetsp:Transcript_4556/g.16022  ORF Transcript_4556/g.16022 Transcript_4556/m.16022 type:complete len:204 (+) Transcript_4556:348-959(+)
MAGRVLSIAAAASRVQARAPCRCHAPKLATTKWERSATMSASGVRSILWTISLTLRMRRRKRRWTSWLATCGGPRRRGRRPRVREERRGRGLQSILVTLSHLSRHQQQRRWNSAQRASTLSLIRVGRRLRSGGKRKRSNTNRSSGSSRRSSRGRPQRRSRSRRCASATHWSWLMPMTRRGRRGRPPTNSRRKSFSSRRGSTTR